MGARTTSPAPVGDHGRDPGCGCHLRGDDLAAHAAATERRALPHLDLTRARTLGEELGAGLPRSARVHAFDLGQEHEQARTDEHGDLGRECVVVAEGDLVGRGRIVLVHDRDGAETEELGERLARVHVRRAIGDVVRREQDLCGSEPFGCQRLVPGRLQARLSESGGRLESRNAARPSLQPEPREAECDRARGDDARRLARAHELT